MICKQNTRQMALAASALVMILVLLVVVVSPVTASEQVASATTQANTATLYNGATTFQEVLTEEYLGSAGYKSLSASESGFTLESSGLSQVATYNATSGGEPVTVNVISLLQVQNGTTTKGYTYTATFLCSDGKSYSVQTLYSTTTSGNAVTNTSVEQITGSMNYYSLSVDEKSVVGDTVLKQSAYALQFSNGSESFYISAKSLQVWTLNESSILSGNGTLDENIVNPTGHYVLTFSPDPSHAMGVKATITMPNGTVIDPGFYQFVDSWHGSNHLQGWILWLEPNANLSLGLVLAALGLILAVFATAGLVVGVIGFMVSLAGFFACTSGYIYMYFDIIWWTWLIFSGCLYSEAGFWTDKVAVPLTNTIYYFYYRGLFPYRWYVPVWNSVIFSVLSTLDFSGDFEYAHTDAWPNGF